MACCPTACMYTRARSASPTERRDPEASPLSPKPWRRTVWLRASTNSAGAGFAWRTAPVRLSDGTLAGSVLIIDRVVHNSVRFLGIPVEDRVRMTSETPAEILSLSEKARIAPGADADLVILSTQGMVKETIVAGETVYQER